jgi:hypothetical protein
MEEASKGRMVTFLQKGMKPIKSWQPEHKPIRTKSQPSEPSTNGVNDQKEGESAIRLALEFLYPNHLFPTQILYVDKETLLSESSYFRQLYKEQVPQEAKKPSLKINVGDLQKIIGA